MKRLWQNLAKCIGLALCVTLVCFNSGEQMSNQDPSPIYSLLEDLDIPSTTLFLEMDDDAFQNLCLGTQHHPGFNALCTKTMLSQSPSDLPSDLLSQTPCDQCKGLGTYAYELYSCIHNTSLSDIYQANVSFLKQFLLSLEDPLPCVPDILHKLELLERVGLGYVILGQEQSSLSDGEHYRLLLAKTFSSGLTDIIYLLEDPLAYAQYVGRVLVAALGSHHFLVHITHRLAQLVRVRNASEKCAHSLSESSLWLAHIFSPLCSITSLARLR